MRVLSPGNRACWPWRPGFTVIGLVSTVAVVVLLAALAIPLYDKAKNTATLRSTMADMAMWDRAFQAYISDHGAAPTNPNGKTRYKKPILREMLPYLNRIRSSDWWGNNYWIWTGDGPDEYGIRRESASDYIMASLGKGGLRESWTYDPGRPQAGLYDVREPLAFEKDIVLWNGRFVRGPKNSK